jgi:ribosomal protein L31
MDHNLTTSSNCHPNWYGDKWETNTSQIIEYTEKFIHFMNHFVDLERKKKNIM